MEDRAKEEEEEQTVSVCFPSQITYSIVPLQHGAQDPLETLCTLHDGTAMLVHATNAADRKFRQLKHGQWTGTILQKVI